MLSGPHSASFLKRIDTLSGKIERFEKVTPGLPVELADLRDQIGRLSARASDLPSLSGNVRMIDDRASSMATTLISVRDELNTMRAQARKGASSASAPSSTTDSERSVAVDASPPTEDLRILLQGIKLFKQNRFHEAIGVFNRLERTIPGDARVRYFAALSQGFATNQWSGDTERLVEKGIERERAGTPGTGVIDAAFNDLSPAQGRDWPSDYRRRIENKAEDVSTSPAGSAR